MHFSEQSSSYMLSSCNHKEFYITCNCDVRAGTLSYTHTYIIPVFQWRIQEFFRGWGVQQIQLRTEDRENGGSGGGNPLVRGSGGSCNLVQEIAAYIVTFS